MPICLTCKHQFTLYEDGDRPYFIEECWCGGYTIDRELLSKIHDRNTSLRKTMHLFQLDMKLDQTQEREMVNYAIVTSLLEDGGSLKSYIIEKKPRQDYVQYLMKIVEYVLKELRCQS